MLNLFSTQFCGEDRRKTQAINLTGIFKLNTSIYTILKWVTDIFRKLQQQEFI